MASILPLVLSNRTVEQPAPVGGHAAYCSPARRLTARTTVPASTAAG